MNPPYANLAGVPLANLLAVAGLACLALAIFGWFSGTFAAGARFRIISGTLGTLILFYVYGIYSPQAVNAKGDAKGSAASLGAEPIAPAQPQSQLQTQSQTQSQPKESAPQGEQPTVPPQASVQPAQQIAEVAQHSQAAQQPAQAQPASLFSGKWRNSDPNTASVVFLKVEQQGDQLSVRAWGLCATQFCDWGIRRGVVNGGSADVLWNQGSVQRRMKLLPAAGSLRMVLDSTYKDHRSPQHTEEHFAKSL